VLSRRRDDRKKRNPLLILYVKRGEEEILLPEPEIPMKIGDRILMAGDRESFDDVEYIMENINELHYVLTGEECRQSLVDRMLFK